MYPLWFEAVKLKRPSESGLHLIPHSISTAVAGMCTGWYLKKSGKYKRALVIWSLVSAISFVFLSGMDLTTGPIAQWLLIVSQNHFNPSQTTRSLFIILPQEDWSIQESSHDFIILYYTSRFPRAPVLRLWWPLPLVSDGATSGAERGINLVNPTTVGFIASVNRSDIAVVTGLTYLSRYTGQVVGVALVSYWYILITFIIRSSFAFGKSDRTEISVFVNFEFCRAVRSYRRCYQLSLRAESQEKELQK